MISPDKVSFRRNFIWNFAGNSLYNLAQWLLIVSLTHLSSPHLVGTFSLMLAISAPVFLTVGMNLRIAQATDVIGRFQLSDYLALRMMLNGIATVITVGVGLVLGIRGAALTALLILGFAKSVEATSQSYYGFFQRHERLDLVSRSLLARSALGPAFFLAGFVMTDSLIGAIIGLTLGWAIVQLILDRPHAQRLHSSYNGRPVPRLFPCDWEAMRRMTRIYAPLGVDAGVSSLAINIPRYVVQLILGAGQLALFATLAYLGQVVSMVTSTMAAVVVPRLATYHHQGRRRAFIRLLALLVAFGLGVSMIGVLGALTLADPLLGFILDPQYIRADLLAVLMLAAGATTLQRSLCKGLEAARRFSNYMIVDALTTIAILACAFPMVASWGVMGAAWSLVAGFSIGSLAVLYILADIIRSMPSQPPMGDRPTD